MEQKKYMDIQRLQVKYADVFTPGEHVVISEKIDGANSSFTYNKETDSAVAFSRKQELSETNTLRGFWNLVQTFSKDVVKTLTEDGRYIFFGEYLVSHTVPYLEPCYQKFYMFDVYDTVDEVWMPHSFTFNKFNAAVSAGLDIKFVPVFFDGKFVSWEDLMLYVGTTALGGEMGEGIVVKSQDRLNENDPKKPIYLKIVSEKFSEVHSSKPRKTLSPEELKVREEGKEKVASIVTKRRAEKLLEKLVDEGVIPEDWDETNMGAIAKVIGKLMYEDCRKEEEETVLSIESFGKICNSITMAHVKEILKDRQSLL